VIQPPTRCGVVRTGDSPRMNSVVAAENETKACAGSHYFYVGNMFDRARQARFQVEDLREVAVVEIRLFLAFLEFRYLINLTEFESNPFSKCSGSPPPVPLFPTSPPLKVGSHDASSRISWYKILYQGTERSTGISFSFFLDLSSDFIAM